MADVSWPVRAFRIVDLPTDGRPTRPTVALPDFLTANETPPPPPWERFEGCPSGLICSLEGVGDSHEGPAVDPYGAPACRGHPCRLGFRRGRFQRVQWRHGRPRRRRRAGPPRQLPRRP